MHFRTVLLFLLTCLALYFHGSFSQEPFKIVGLFPRENYNMEKSFYYAVKRHNMYNPDIVFQEVIRYVPTEDIYDMSKIVCNLIRDIGPVAIIGPQSIDGVAITQSICEKLEIPHIQVHWKAAFGRPSEFSLNFYPDTDLLAKGLGSIIRHMEWKRYVIIIENDHALVRLQEVLKIPSVDDAPVTIRKIEPNSDVRFLFKELRNSSISRIILDCDTDNVINYLYQAKSIGMLKDFFDSYFITSLDAHTLDFSVLNTAANITTVRIVNPENTALQNAIMDWNIGQGSENDFESVSADTVRTDAALIHDATYLLMESIRELRLTASISPSSLNCTDSIVWEDGLRLASYMKKRGAKSSITGPLHFNSEGQRINFSLEVVEVMGKTKHKTATWHSNDPDNLEFMRSPEDKEMGVFKHFQNTTLIVSSRIGRPYLMNKTDEDGNVKLEGYCYDLMRAIASYLNLTIKFVLAADNKYGSYVAETNSWNGIIKDLLDHRAHLGICDLTITRERREVVDFSLPFMHLGISILYKKNQPEERNIFAFMEPFSLEVWVFTVTAYLGVSLVLYLVARMAPGDWENPHPCDDNPEELENIWNLKNCMWLTVGSIMTQGCDILPKGLSSRMASSMWWFFSLLMTSSYTANLAAFLTKQQKGPNIDSAEALLKSKVKYGLLDGGSTMTFFRTSNFSLYKRMWVQMQQFKPSVFENDNSDGVKRVLNTKQNLYAFFMENTGIEYEVERNCSLKQVGDTLDNKGYGIAMPLGAPYRSLINKAILQLQEDGTLTRLKQKWWKEKYGGGACDDEPPEVDINDQKLGLANVGGVFLVLGIGVSIAIIIAIVEFLWNVRNVSVEEHITFFEALILETKFATNIWEERKPTKPKISESSSSSSSTGVSETQSIAKKMLHGAASFLNIDKISMASKRENEND